MNPRASDLFRFVLLMMIVAAPVLAQDDEEEEFKVKTSAPPAERIGGAWRGGSDAPSLSVLAPASTVGLTTHAQPVIYWYLSGDTAAPIEIGISSPKNLANPVLEVKIAGPKKAGIQRLDLEKQVQNGKPIQLEPGVKYDVAITLVAKETDASENPTATCRIMVLKPEEIPAAVKTEKDPAKRASIYAKEGIWFDYLDALNTAIDTNSKDEALLARRTKALAAQGLIWKPDGTITEKTVAK